MSNQTTKKSPVAAWKIGGGLVGLLALLAALIAANVIVGNLRIRRDLTEDRVYTLSSGSRAILGKLQHTVTLRFFFTASAPDVPEFLKSYARQVEDLLREYELASHGRIVVEKRDPKPDSDDEELAQRLGISRQSIGFNGPGVYIGIAAQCGESEESIPVLDPRAQETLEYALTRMIYRVDNPRKPVLGVMSSLPVLGSSMPPFMFPGQQQPSQQPWIAFRDLRQDFDVREVETAAPVIPPEIDVLIVVHPKELTDKTLYALDQFVLRGGRLLAFLDPLSVMDMENSGAQQFRMPRGSSDLGRLLTAWGVSYDPTRVLADLGSTTRIRGRDNQPEESPVYLSLMGSSLNSNDLTTAQTEMLLMPFAGAFTGDGAQGLTVTPLITSSVQSALMDPMMVQGGADMIRRRFKSDGHPYSLAVRLHGRFATAFPEGRPQEPGETNSAEAAQATLTESVSASTVILVGDSDMLYDNFWSRSLNLFGSTVQQPFNDNISFFANAVEQLAGSTDFVNIRCRGRTSRPFTRVLALQQQAQAQWLEQEKMLQERLEETQQRLAELQGQKDEKQRFVLSPEQKEAIERFRQTQIETERDLRAVRKSLREGIEQLGTILKAVNILAVPLVVCAAGLGFGLFRRSRTR